MLQDSALVVPAIIAAAYLLGLAIAFPLMLRDRHRHEARRSVDGYVNRHARMKATGRWDV